MVITTKDIRNVRFTKAFQGYNVKEVDDFIDECAEAMEDLMQKLGILADELLKYRNVEKCVQDI